ncbi:MAG: YkvA family protein [Bacteroidota bacterium]
MTDSYDKSSIDEKYIRKNAKSVDKSDIDNAIEKEDEIKQKSTRFGKYKESIKLLFGLLRDYRAKRYTQTPWMSIAAIVFALLYIFNPMDIIPDFVPLIGYIDDASVLALTLKLVKDDLEVYKSWKGKNRSTD